MRTLGPYTPTDPRTLVDRGYVDGIVSSGTTYYQPLAAPQAYSYTGSNVFTLPQAAGQIVAVTVNGQTLQPSESTLTTSTTVTVSPTDYTLATGDAITITYALNASFTGTTSADLEFTDPTRGVILRSPNGTRWRVTVSNTGTLITTAVT